MSVRGVPIAGIVVVHDAELISPSNRMAHLQDATTIDGAEPVSVASPPPPAMAPA